MEYFTTTSAASRRSSSCIIVGIYKGNKLSPAAQNIDKASGGLVTRLLKRGDASGNLGMAALVPGMPGVRAERIALVGLGPASGLDAAQFRRALKGAVSVIAKRKLTDVVCYLNQEPVSDCSPYYLARHTAEIIGAGAYRFTAMKSGRTAPKSTLARVGLALNKRGDDKQALLGAQHADGIVTGMNLTRELGNLPPNVCTPSYLARTAQKLARQYSKLSTRIVSEAEMKRLGMHSLLSVTAGADEPAKLIVMQYKGAGKDKPIVLVGKGITFDSGGISLKPGPGMDEMKYDMGGAASVFGAMATVAKLGLPVNLTVVVPSCENMPGGGATRPGDIVKSMSGQTIEILNTDAEGRLVLCDALTYARRFKPAVIIDVATLTGACVIALGHHHTAVMSHKQNLADDLLSAGVNAEDRAWRLPLATEYAEQLRSNFADFANVGGRDGGAITAGCFLAKFTDGLNWAHLDIAGTAWTSGRMKGSTGRPVPLLGEFILDRAGLLP